VRGQPLVIPQEQQPSLSLRDSHIFWRLPRTSPELVVPPHSFWRLEKNPPGALELWARSSASISHTLINRNRAPSCQHQRDKDLLRRISLQFESSCVSLLFKADLIIMWVFLDNACRLTDLLSRPRVQAHGNLQVLVLIGFSSQIVRVSRYGVMASSTAAVPHFGRREDHPVPW
jgi:hypothetical protein